MEKLVSKENFDHLNFEETRSIIKQVEAKLSDISNSQTSSQTESYIEFKKIQKNMENAKVDLRKIDKVLASTSEIKLPFKLETSTNMLSICLLDLEFEESLKKNLAASKKEFKKSFKFSTNNSEINQDLPITPKTNKSRRTNEYDSQPENNKLSFFRNMRNFNQMNTAISSQNEIKKEDSVKLESMQPKQNPHRGSFRSACSLQEQKSRITKNNFREEENYYDMGNPSETPTEIITPPVIMGRNPSTDFRLGNKRNSFVSQTNRQSVSRNDCGSSKETSLTRKNQLTGKKFTKYSSSLITVNENSGVITNQIIDERKLKMIMTSLRCVPRHVQKVELMNNVFKCNPVPMLKESFQARLGYSLILDLSKNQIMTNVVYNKRDVEYLQSCNICIFN